MIEAARKHGPFDPRYPRLWRRPVRAPRSPASAAYAAGRSFQELALPEQERVASQALRPGKTKVARLDSSSRCVSRAARNNWAVFLCP
jgi:hypothetical protein